MPGGNSGKIPTAPYPSHCASSLQPRDPDAHTHTHKETQTENSPPAATNETHTHTDMDIMLTPSKSDINKQSSLNPQPLKHSGNILNKTKHTFKVPQKHSA